MARLLKTLGRLALVAGLAGVVYGAWITPSPRAPLAARNGPSIQEARNWGYQLQNAAPDRIPAAIDVLVIDSQRYSEPHATVAPETVAHFKARPDGRPRIVLAYLSIGEAERYRYYWRAHWSLTKPSFIGPENTQWKGNYRVRFWERGWQSILFEPNRSLLQASLERVTETRTAYLDRIIEAGFDGVYLDRVDVYEEWRGERPTAEADMMALVGALSSYAKARRPGFLVVPQNGEELLRHASYRRTIDAIGKEDLFFGIDHSEGENKPADVAASISLLGRARADKIPVMVVEYVTGQDKRTRAEARARERGFLLHFATRQLNQSPELPVPATTSGGPTSPSPTSPASAPPGSTPPKDKKN